MKTIKKLSIISTDLPTSQEALGDRMKSYEKNDEKTIDYNKPILVRIDGHKFSKFTKKFRKPFDVRFSNAMISTTEKLVTSFGAVCGYTQSDEITLILAPTFKELKHKSSFKEIREEGLSLKDFVCTYKNIDFDIKDLHKPSKDLYILKIADKISGALTILKAKSLKELDSMAYPFLITIDNNQVHSGRVQKLVSLMSARATRLFNKEFYAEYDKELLEHNEYFGNSFRLTTEEEDSDKYLGILSEKLFDAEFDARVFGVPSAQEAYNAVMWRVRDCVKNSASMFAQAYCSHKSLNKKNTQEQIDFCLETTGKDWNKIEDKYKYGVLIKRQNVIKKIEDKYLKYHNGKKEAIRTETVRISKQYTSFSDENVELFMKNKLPLKKSI